MKRTISIVRAVFAALIAAAFLIACGSGGGPGGQNDGPVTASGQPVQLSSHDASVWFELENTADESLEWTIRVDHDAGNPDAGDWFDIEPREGTLEPFGRRLVTLTQRSGLSAGTYRSVLTVVYRGGETGFEVVGEVEPAGSSADGDGSISGRLESDNALIPIRPPSAFARSSLGTNDAPVGERPEFVSGQLVVGLEPSARPLSAESDESWAQTLGRRHDVTILGESSASDGGPGATLVVELAPGVDPADVASRLEADRTVRFVEPNYLFYPHSLPNDPHLADAWQLPVVGAPVAWHALPELGSGPVVAVIDSGIDLDHEDLRGAFVSGGYDFCGTRDCTSRDSDPRPAGLSDTHGTHVTGLLAAISGNGRGLAGVVARNARVLPVKVFHDGFTTAAALAEAIRWASGQSVSGVPGNPNPAAIITLSLGAGNDSRAVREAIVSAQDRGSLIVASAGNQGENQVDFPARYQDVLGVGAVNSEFRRSCFSDYGDELDLMAPGGDGYLCNAPRDEVLLSTFPGDDYGADAGTSMAAPLVAGAAALVWAEMTAPDAGLVSKRLLDTAHYDPDYMTGERYGAGVLRVDAALGFPGPGDRSAVQASGPSTALDTVTLDRSGSSSRFSLEDLAAGRYALEVDAAGSSRPLSGARTVDLSGGQQASLPRPCRFVGAPARQRVEHVDNAEQSCQERDLPTRQSGRITLTVPTLVMVANQTARRRRQERQLGEHIEADLGVLAHLHPFTRTQRSGFEQDPVGKRDLADVVEVGAPAQRLAIVLTQPQVLAEPSRHRHHPVGVPLGFQIATLQQQSHRAQAGVSSVPQGPQVLRSDAPGTR
ncbi:MAG: S8 family serine peptidase [Trueperaceae bacterium]